MKPFPLPVVAFGPGSQPEDEELQYLPMPHDMASFHMPRIPVAATEADYVAARRVIGDLIDAMKSHPFDGPAPATLDLGSLTDGLKLVNESLGEGEVSIVVRAPRSVHVQETAFAGVWRVQYLREDGSVDKDLLQCGAMPAVVAASVDAVCPPSLTLATAPDDVMNSPALLAEILDHARNWQPGNPAHVINLTLLPVNASDLDYLASSLGQGPVTMLSRGYGNCRITATALAHVWWVQCYNSTDAIILNTLEIVEIPEVALAAKEDFDDSIDRLGEWLDTLQAD